MIKFAVENAGVQVLADLEDITKEMWLEIVSFRGEALQYCKDQTQEIAEAAIKQNSIAKFFVRPASIVTDAFLNFEDD